MNDSPKVLKEDLFLGCDSQTL